MGQKQTYIVTIGRTKIEICATCYQRLRRAGKLRTRPYRHRPEVPEEKKSDDQGGIMQ